MSELEVEALRDCQGLLRLLRNIAVLPVLDLDCLHDEYRKIVAYRRRFPKDDRILKCVAEVSRLYKNVYGLLC